MRKKVAHSDTTMQGGKAKRKDLRLEVASTSINSDPLSSLQINLVARKQEKRPSYPTAQEALKKAAKKEKKKLKL